jgi:hypothetical protein
MQGKVKRVDKTTGRCEVGATANPASGSKTRVYVTVYLALFQI